MTNRAPCVFPPELGRADGVRHWPERDFRPRRSEARQAGFHFAVRYAHKGCTRQAFARDIGVSHVISLGDSADVDLGDVLDYLVGNGDTLCGIGAQR